jgi:hypothetical protein
MTLQEEATSLLTKFKDVISPNEYHNIITQIEANLPLLNAIVDGLPLYYQIYYAISDLPLVA